MQVISNDKTVRNDTIQDLKEFNPQSSKTQAEKGEQLVSMMPAIEESFNLLGDDIVELSTENDALKRKQLFTMKNGLKNLKQDCYNRSMMKKEQI